MKRFYRSALVQNAKRQWVPEIVLSDVWINRSEGDMSVITSDFVDGQPVVPWCLCAVEFKDHAALAALPNTYLWPDYPLDVKVQAMNGPTRALLRSRLLADGVDISALDNADGFRDVLNTVAHVKLNNEGFDADSFNP